MKNKKQFLNWIAISMLVSVAAMADERPRLFTSFDYQRLIAETGVTVQILSPEAANTLRDLGGECDEAILASVVTSIFDQAMRDGVDLPEQSDVRGATSFAEHQSVGISTDSHTYSVTLGAKGRVCVAGAADLPSIKAIERVIRHTEVMETVFTLSQESCGELRDDDFRLVVGPEQIGGPGEAVADVEIRYVGHASSCVDPRARIYILRTTQLVASILYRFLNPNVRRLK